MLIKFVVALSIMIGGTAWGSDFEQECRNKLPGTTIKVVPIEEKKVYDPSKSLQELQGMGRNYERNKAILGLTVAQPKAQVATEGTGLKDLATGRYCFSPQVTVSLTFDPMHIYVAKEFKPGTCEYDHILRHENDHVKAYQRKLREASVWLEGQLRGTFNRPVYFGNREEMLQQMKEAINEYWLPLVSQKMNEVEKDHQKIDTPAEYAKNNTACKGKINEAVLRFRGG